MVPAHVLNGALCGVAPILVRHAVVMLLSALMPTTSAASFHLL
jgi:hypothetical protein